MDIRGKKILVLAPHADDAEVAMGATINRLTRENVVDVEVFSLPPDVDQTVVFNECIAALGEIGVVAEDMEMPEGNPRQLNRQHVLDYLYRMRKRYDIVFTPNSKDIHQTHRLVYEETRRAFKHSTILGYEAPWNSFGFDNQVYIRIEEEDLVAKERAMAKYKTQRGRDMFLEPIARELARIRGQQVGVGLAECFEAIRIIV